MASGFSLSEIGTDGGCCLKVVGAGGGGGGGGALRGRDSERSMGASWATVAVGVMGETGGRSEVGDSERFCEAPEVDEASLEDGGRKSVLTSSAGISAESEDVSRRGARESSAAFSKRTRPLSRPRPRPRGWRGEDGGRCALGPESAAGKALGGRAGGGVSALLRCAPRLSLPCSRARAWWRCYRGSGEEVAAPALRPPFVENGVVGTTGKRMLTSTVAWVGTAEDSGRLCIAYRFLVQSR